MKAPDPQILAANISEALLQYDWESPEAAAQYKLLISLLVASEVFAIVPEKDHQSVLKSYTNNLLEHARALQSALPAVRELSEKVAKAKQEPKLRRPK